MATVISPNFSVRVFPIVSAIERRSSSESFSANSSSVRTSPPLFLHLPLYLHPLLWHAFILFLAESLFFVSRFQKYVHLRIILLDLIPSLEIRYISSLFDCLYFIFLLFFFFFQKSLFLFYFAFRLDLSIVLNIKKYIFRFLCMFGSQICLILKEAEIWISLFIYLFIFILLFCFVSTSIAEHVNPHVILNFINFILIFDLYHVY